MRAISIARATLGTALVAALLAGCYSFAQPSYHPGDARDLLLSIARRGVDVERSMVGESACSDPGLIENAIHLRGSVASDPTVRDIWIYAFRSKGWEVTAPAVDACQAEWEATDPGTEITRLDIPVYRAFGADWSPELEAAVRDGLTEAASAGLPGG